MQIKGEIATIIHTAFQSLLLTYLLLLLIEQIWVGAVSLYLNITYILVVVLVLGVLDAMSVIDEEKPKKATVWDQVFIIILAIVTVVILLFKTSQLGFLSYIISVIAGAIVYLVSSLILDEYEQKHVTAKQSEEQPYEYIMGTLSYKHTTIVVFCICVVLVLILIGFGLSIMDSLRIVFGSVYVLFLPGFLLSFHFFLSNEIDWLERLALSFGLSIAIVPLTVFYTNLVGVRMSALMIFFVILCICFVTVLTLFFRKRLFFQNTLLVKTPLEKNKPEKKKHKTKKNSR